MKLNLLIENMVMGVLQEGPYGQVLFGQERGKPDPKKPEVDTAPEKNLYNVVKQHHIGDMDALGMNAPSLAALANRGEYQDILKSPNAYAYRFLFGVDENVMSTITGQSMFSLEHVEQSQSGTFTPKGRPHASWTLWGDKEKLVNLAKALNSGGFLDVDQGKFACLLVAATGDNQGKFILNPAGIAEIPELRHYAESEKEIISVGTIKLRRVIWCASNEINDGNVETMTQAILQVL